MVRRELNMAKVYLLQHSYEIEHEGVSIDRTKLIGIYSTEEKAEAVIERYKNIEGFDKYPITCFNIGDYDLDKDHWTEGFVSIDDMAEDFKTLTSCLNEWLGIKKTAEESWEDDDYYQAIWDVNKIVDDVKDAQELAEHISKVWSVRFKKNPKTSDECMGVATKILSSLKLWKGRKAEAMAKGQAAT